MLLALKSSYFLSLIFFFAMSLLLTVDLFDHSDIMQK